MAYTKIIPKSDKITIDGTDVSSSFKRMSRPSTDAKIDASGFNSTGVDENLNGARTQTFTGEAFYTEELGAIVEPHYTNRTACTITWQPNGLVDPTREIYSGSCTIDEFSPESSRGDVSTFPFVASPVDGTAITVGNWT